MRALVLFSRDLRVHDDPAHRALALARAAGCDAIFATADVTPIARARERSLASGAASLGIAFRLAAGNAVAEPGEVVSRAAREGSGDAFVRQLAWRNLFRQLFAADPRLLRRDLRPGPATPAPGPDTEEALERWRAGETGMPLVDAGMRQLLREGWMHNRARMVTASFLTRRLGVPWQEGADHFLRHLVDGDPANNAGGWQWAAGTGTDPRRSRAFDPVRQAKRFDPSGVYIRRYVAELRNVPVPSTFAPWKDERLLRLNRYPGPVLEVPEN